MNRHRTLCVALSIGWLGLAGPSATGPRSRPPRRRRRRARAARPSGIELALLRSLQANPLTAPYQFATEPRGKQIALKGRVGTKQIHDVAIQTAIALGVPVVDELVIDTAAAHQVAAYPGPGRVSGGAGYRPELSRGGLLRVGPLRLSPADPGQAGRPVLRLRAPGLRLPALVGCVDRPAARPPARRLDARRRPRTSRRSRATIRPSARRPTGPTPPTRRRPASPYGTIDMAIDSRGVATLRGTVPSLAERIALGQRVAQTPGVSQVINLLNVQATPAGRRRPTRPRRRPCPSNVPGPPPRPPGRAIEPAASAPADGAADRGRRRPARPAGRRGRSRRGPGWRACRSG